MATAAFDITVKDCDLDDVEACRGKVIGAIDDPAFTSLIGDLETARAAAATPAVPRDGAPAKPERPWYQPSDAQIKIEIGKGGDTSASGTVGWKWP